MDKKSQDNNQDVPIEGLAPIVTHSFNVHFFGNDLQIEVKTEFGQASDLEDQLKKFYSHFSDLPNLGVECSIYEYLEQVETFEHHSLAGLKNSLESTFTYWEKITNGLFNLELRDIDKGSISEVLLFATINDKSLLEVKLDPLSSLTISSNFFTIRKGHERKSFTPKELVSDTSFEDYTSITLREKSMVILESSLMDQYKLNNRLVTAIANDLTTAAILSLTIDESAVDAIGTINKINKAIDSKFAGYVVSGPGKTTESDYWRTYAV